jgi:hypothetical protein
MKSVRNWFLGTVLGVIVLSVVANLISNAIPNPIDRLLRQWRGVPPPQWHAAVIMNDTTREISIGVWEHGGVIWGIYTLGPRTTKTFCDTGPIYIKVQGDMIYEQEPRERLTHTYEGNECYELSGPVFTRKPTDTEIRGLKANRIVEIIGKGANTKVLKFAAGPSINFEVVWPNGAAAKTLLPEVKGGMIVYSFQNSDNR